MFIRTSHNTFISKCAKKHSHKALILCATELEVGGHVCTRNILDQKLSIFEPNGKYIWPRTCIRRKM